MNQGTRPGPRNLITDVEGIRVGNAQDARVRTGVTVVLPDARAVAAVDVRGGAPGTRETDALDGASLVEAVDAIVLAGGSVYGLDAASAVTKVLGADGRGFKLGQSSLVAPVVPAAILFDLANGGEKDWGRAPPYDRLGVEALARVGETFALGNAGAGLGARAGAYKGGLGSASVVSDTGFSVGALVAVNSFGSPVMPGTDYLWAALYEQQGEMGGRKPSLPQALTAGWPADTKTASAAPGTNTTIGIVATNAALTRAEAQRVAIMGQDGFARALRPVHTPFDGDVLFVLATATRPLAEPRALAVAELGLLAADCVARAIGRGVHEAKSLPGLPHYRDKT